MQWIKCSEKLPEKEGRYLIISTYDSYDNEITINSIKIEDYHPNFKNDWEENYIIYWQPLPKLPEPII